MRVDEMLVKVYASWNGWATAEVPLAKLKNVHWLQPERAQHEFLFGSISCADIVTGHIPHDCDHRSAPHNLLVCVLKRHVVSRTYAELVRSADISRTRALVPAST